MLKDVKAGLNLWKNITNLYDVSVQFILFAAAGVMANRFVAFRLYERVKTISLMLNMDAREMIMTLAALHLIVFGGMMKRIVHEACGRNQYFFYQLAVSKRAGCICTMLQQLNWYGYGLVMLFAICSHAVMPGWFLIPLYTLAYIIGICIYYGMEDLEGYKKKKFFFRDRRSGRPVSACTILCGNMF